MKEPVVNFAGKSPYVAQPSLGSTPNRDVKVSTPGGTDFSEPVTVNLSHFWHIVDALATETVTIRLDESNRTITRWRGSLGTVARGFTRISFSTPTPQTILVSLGDEFELDTPRTGSGSGFPVPLPVVGTALPGDHVPDAAMPPEIGVFMVKPLGDGTNLLFPLHTEDGNRLLVGYQDQALGNAVAIGVPTDVTQFATARLSIFTGGGADAFLVDDLNLPLGYYEANGTFHGDGKIPAGTAAGTVFYVPLTAVLDFTLNSTSGAWSFNVRLSQNVFVP